MGNCTARNIQLDPGSVLDRVISQASNDDDCLLYKLANYKKGGELIEAYGIGGAHEVEKLIREQFGILMYQEGKGQVVSRTEYLRWKFRNIKQVVIPVEPTSATDPLGKWQDHQACWQMQYRGSLGETLLHVLIICDTRLHTRLARILVKCFPKVALDVFEGEEYLGASALHLAIAYNNNELVHLLVEAGASVEQRAIGSFFLPKDQQRVIPSKQTDYEGLAYLGEYPLAWAACVGNESVYNLLVDKGAHPDWQDTFGNMILHMVVVTDQLGMYGYALRHPRIVASNGIMNTQGLTPLTLACRLGRASVFREMLELSCREFWRYSNVTCSAYPLNALDTISPDGRTNWNSALFMILAGSKEDHLNMLDGGIIQRLLEEKWKTFARRQFLKRITIAFVHLLAMSLAVYTRPDDRTQSLSTYNDVRSLFRLGFEVGTILNCVSYVVFQQGEEIKNQGFVSFIKQLPHAPPKAIFLVANLIILSCIPFRIWGDIETEEALLTFAMVGSWFFMIFFAGAIKLTGPFITMIFSMITGDMLTFGIIYLIFLLAFSQAFYYLYKSHPAVTDLLFVDYPSTWMAMYQMTLGQYSYGDLALTAYPNMSKGVFITFMILVPILLLNMLIAMMGNTYSQVIERSEKEWVKQWAKLVVTLERAVSQDLAKQHIQEYSIKLGGVGVDELRGVMVIKTKSKTRANQRKGAISNWKRVGKVTITALKKRGMTGEEMRILMWGHRTSISTPQALTPRQQSMEIDPAFVITNRAPQQASYPGSGMATEASLLPPDLSGADGTSRADGSSPVPSNLFGCFDDRLSSDNSAVPPVSPAVNITGDFKKTNTISSPLITSLPAQKGGKKLQAQHASTSAQAERDEKHYLSMLEGSIPVVIPKVKRRNITTGLRPKIIIFSDKKDMIRVSLDSDESDNDLSDVPPASTARIKMKSARRQSIAGESFTINSSREDLRGDTDDDDMEGDGGGFVNRAYEPDEPPTYSVAVQPEEAVNNQSKRETPVSFKETVDDPQPPPRSSTPAASSSKPDEKLKHENTKQKRPKSAKTREAKEPAAEAAGKQKEPSADTPTPEPKPESRKKRSGRSSSAAPGGKRGHSSGSKQETIPEEARARPRTAFDASASAREISSMNKLVAWDRPEDDI